MPKRIYRDPSQLLVSDVAALLGVRTKTLESWLRKGFVPQPSPKRGKRRIWSPDEARELKKYVHKED